MTDSLGNFGHMLLTFSLCLPFSKIFFKTITCPKHISMMSRQLLSALHLHEGFFLLWECKDFFCGPWRLTTATFNTDSSWVTTAVRDGISIAKQCDNNPGCPHCHYWGSRIVKQGPRVMAACSFMLASNKVNGKACRKPQVPAVQGIPEAKVSSGFHIGGWAHYPRKILFCPFLNFLLHSYLGWGNQIGRIGWNIYSPAGIWLPSDIGPMKDHLLHKSSQLCILVVWQSAKPSLSRFDILLHSSGNSGICANSLGEQRPDLGL